MYYYVSASTYPTESNYTISLGMVVVVTTPVIGKSSGLVPAVDVSTIVWADMTNNSIEEELRLTVAFHSISIYFRHYQATGTAWMGRRSPKMKKHHPKKQRRFHVGQLSHLSMGELTPVTNHLRSVGWSPERPGQWQQSLSLRLFWKTWGRLKSLGISSRHHGLKPY